MSYKSNPYLPHPSDWDWLGLLAFLIGTVFIIAGIAIVTTVVGDHQKQTLERNCHAIPHTYVVTGDIDYCLGIKNGDVVQLFHD